VAVEEKPAVAGGTNKLFSFQDDFAQKMKTDPDMLERGEGIKAIAASLSHSHLNCSMRNIIGGNKGCECPLESTKCECASCPYYSMAKLKYYDDAWAKDCHSGLEWEMLSWKMDVIN